MEDSSRAFHERERLYRGARASELDRVVGCVYSYIGGKKRACVGSAVEDV